MHQLTGLQNDTREYDEKALPPKVGQIDDEEEDQDIDALIEELESQDAGADYDEEEEIQAGAARVVPEELLQTDVQIGLTASEVVSRRKKFGLNQMKGKHILSNHTSYPDFKQRRRKT